MSHLPNLIADLALILILAGVITLLFKKLKQPLVLGYIVAGFVASPKVALTPTVIDTTSIQTWADIGVIFLLFALGLEFSIKKIAKVGGTAVIAAGTIIICMILTGITAGLMFGWHRMDCMFLGGMIAMSSTTIIYKAFEDLGLRRKKFAGLVLSILILEDILAILLMVLLSTMAVSQHIEGEEMLMSIGKLIFFLIIWFVVGIFLIPSFLKRTRKLMSDETLLIVSLGMCFGMVVLASQAGLSPAFGAFIMGSILAETIEAEHIDSLVKPVKNLFGAIFFVSVGMMVDPAMIVEYALPIAVITIVVVLGQALYGTFGVLISGQPLKIAMQCGFSLTQIGEFAFIIASLGVSLHVTSSFLYPIVVAVSVITTFITPYMIRLADPVHLHIEKRLPRSWRRFLDRYSSGSQTVNHISNWRKLLLALGRNIIIYSALSIAVIILSFRVMVPLFHHSLPSFWASLCASAFTILCISPFLRAIVVKKNHSIEFTTLWEDGHVNRGPLVSTIILRVVIAVMFVMYIIAKMFKASIGLALGLAIILVFMMIYSRKLKKHSILLERKFLRNLRFRDAHAEYMGSKKPAYAGSLLSKDIHLADFEIPLDSAWIGKSLAQLNLGKTYGVHIVSILRGNQRINIPGPSATLFPQDKIQAIGSDAQLVQFGEEMMQSDLLVDEKAVETSEMTLKQFVISSDSAFLGKTIRESGIRDNYKCLIVGVERDGHSLMTPDINTPFLEGDVIWVVGEKKSLFCLFNEKRCD